jgi:hypothetical protein
MKQGFVRRHARWSLVICLLLLAALLWWYVSRSAPVLRPAALLFGPRSANKSPDKVQVASPSVDLAALAPTRRSSAAGEVEICGVGIFKRADLEAGRADPDGLPEPVPVVQALIRSLAEQPEAGARATALLLQANASVWNGTREQAGMEQTPACDGPEPAASGSALALACRAETERREQQRKAEMLAAGEPAAQLVALAQASNDPAVLALAQSFCTNPGRRGIPACRTDLLAAWTRLESGNQYPWLMLLHQAKRTGDGNAVAEALYQLSRATYYRSYAAAAAPWLLRNLPAAGQRNAADLLRGFLADGAVREQAMTAGLAALSLVDACAPEAVRDGNRRQLCLTIADRITSQSDDAGTAILAAVAGKHAGWSDGRFDAVVLPLKALQHAQVQAVMAGPDEIQSLSCEPLQQHSQQLLELHRMGERAQLLRMAQASGKSMDELIAAYRKAEMTAMANSTKLVPGAAIP